MFDSEAMVVDAPHIAPRIGPSASNRWNPLEKIVSEGYHEQNSSAFIAVYLLADL